MSKNDLIVGEWRNGLADPSVVEDIEKRRAQGFRQLAYEGSMVEMIDLLDSYDEFVGGLLNEVDVAPQAKAFKGKG